VLSEKAIETFCCKEAERRGGKAFKFFSPSFRGAPDRIVALPGGKVGFLELKSSIGKPTPLQAHWLKFLSNLGITAGVANSKETVVQFMDTLQNA